jgi:hypothetical protein
MLAYQILFAVFALSLPVVGFVVLVRLLLCAYRALRASRIKLAALAILGIACVAGAFVLAAGVWFAYAVAHAKKDLRSDLEIMLLTGLPFYAVSYAFWRVGRYIRSALDARMAQPGEGVERAGRALPAAKR